MRTARAPATALSGKNISEDSLAISTAILAAPYAVTQPDSLGSPGSSGAIPKEPQDGEPIDRAMTLDEAASTLGSLARGYIAASSCFMKSTGNVGVVGRLFVGVADEGFLRKWCMVDGGTTRGRSSSAPRLNTYHRCHE